MAVSTEPTTDANTDAAERRGRPVDLAPTTGLLGVAYEAVMIDRRSRWKPRCGSRAGRIV